MVESIKELREICQSVDREKGKLPLPVRFARKVSIYFTKLLLYTNITANQTTLLFIFIGLLSGLFFTLSNALYNLIGALLLQLWYIFDHVDGEVARYRRTASITGTYIDFLSHSIIHPYIFACITFGLYNIFQNVTIFGFGFLASLSVLLIDAVEDCMYRALFLTHAQSKNRFTTTRTNDQKILNLNDFSNVLSPIYHFAKLVYNFVRVPSILYLILIAAVLDLAVQPFTISFIRLNFMYLALCGYSIIALFAWIGLVLFYTKNRTADDMYFSLFGDKE